MSIHTRGTLPFEEPTDHPSVWPTSLPGESVHVAHIGFFNDPEGRAPEELLRSWPTLVDVAEAAARAGVRVSVVQSCTRVCQLQRGGACFHFLPFGKSDVSPLAERLRTLMPPPQLLHVHGLGFHRQVLSLAAVLPGMPILLQDHASRPPQIWRRGEWRRGLAVAAGVAFCAAEQAKPFAAAGLLSAHTGVYQIPESTSRFTCGDRRAARRATGIDGAPAVLWVGHLDSNKDPLTVFRGISMTARDLPGLRLYCCFGVAPLMREVEKCIVRDATLRERVHLLGCVSHERIELLMRAADIFVLGSHREGSGYSLIEALACGLPAVVTDIPSFRALTGCGAAGRLWPCGDAHALAAALRHVAAGIGPDQRRAVRAHFERELSLDALGAKFLAMYRAVIRRSR
jgi:hypothetical protein